MKVLIVDNSHRSRGFLFTPQSHPQIKIQNSNFNELDFSNCKIIFKHDTFNYILNNEQKAKIIYIEYTGAGTLKNEIDSNSDGYKFKAKIENPEQVNNVLNIIDKAEFTKDDLEMILNFDPKLEKLLEQFESASPYETTNKQGKVLKDAKTELQSYVGEYLEKQSKA